MATRIILIVLVALAVAVGAFAYVITQAPELLPPWLSYEGVEEISDAIEGIAPACTVASASPVDVPMPEPPLDPVEIGGVDVLDAIPAAYMRAPIVHTPYGFTDHLITPLTSISADAKYDRSPDRDIKLSVIVAEQGDVLAAIPVKGSRTFFRQAVAMAQHWKFKPFWRDGKPSIVRLEHLTVRVRGPERRPRRHAPFPKIQDWNTLRIKLAVRPGWAGPNYDITIAGDGAVTFKGKSEVAVLGTHCAVISRKAVERLVAQFRRAEFFWFYDSYDVWFDAGSEAISIEFDGKSKNIDPTRGSPDAVERLLYLVRETAGANRWLNGNEYTARSLLAERWDIKRDTLANRNLVDGIAQYGDATAMRDVLALGADVSAAWREQEMRPPWWPALTRAADREDGQLTYLLLQSRARWDERALVSALASRAQRADTATVEELLARLPNETTGETLSAVLRSAAYAGVPALVARLLQRKPDVSAPNADGDTALHLATGRKHEPYSMRDESPESALVDRVATVRMLIQAGAHIAARNKYGTTPLMAASETGQPATVVALLKAGADIAARNDDGATALMYAGSPEVVALLLAAGADPLARDKHGASALVHAGRAGKSAVAHALLATRVTWDKQSLDGALFEAAQDGDIELVALLIAKGASVSARGERKRTILMAGAESGVPEVVSLILGAKPDVAATDRFSDTALHLAVQSPYSEKAEHVDRLKVAELLLDAGAPINARGERNRTPAASASDFPTLKLLADRGADLSVRDDYHHTLLFLYVDAQAIRFLLARGLPVNAQDDAGNTAIMNLLEWPRPPNPQMYPSLQILLEAGADLRLRNKRGKTALDLAKQRDREVADLVQQWAESHR